MTDHLAPDPAPHCDLTSPDSITLAAMEMWQELLTVGTAWWNRMIDAWWPERQFHHMRDHHDPRRERSVPESIEADGERASVA